MGKKGRTNRKLNWDLIQAAPGSVIFDFVNHRLNINQSADVVKWTTPVKALRNDYKKYFDSCCALRDEYNLKSCIGFVKVSEFNLLMKRLGVKQMLKYIPVFDKSIGKHITKKMRCWVGCRLIFD